jgi:hypothetical protein
MWMVRWKGLWRGGGSTFHLETMQLILGYACNENALPEKRCPDLQKQIRSATPKTWRMQQTQKHTGIRKTMQYWTMNCTAETKRTKVSKRKEQLKKIRIQQENQTWLNKIQMLLSHFAKHLQTQKRVSKRNALRRVEAHRLLNRDKPTQAESSAFRP